MTTKTRSQMPQERRPMPRRPVLTTEQLTALCEAAYGPSWQMKLANRLDVTQQYAYKLATGERNIGEKYRADLEAIIEEATKDLQARLETLAKMKEVLEQ
ncbi:MAG: hypothetical protein AAGF20_00765 [Pseudomonadota bacterium]